MADPWVVANEAPAADPWAVAHEAPADAWTPVSQTPIAAAGLPLFDPRSVKESLQRATEGNPQKVLSAVLREPGHMAQGMLDTAAAPGRVLQSTEPITTEQMVEPAANLAMLGGVRMAKTVGGARPSAAGAEEAPKPVAAPETIRSAAIWHDGKVYEGQLHSDAYQSAADATGKEFGAVIGKTKPNDAGFVTSTGRYVTRNEAAKLVGYEGPSELSAEHFPEGTLGTPKAADGWKPVHETSAFTLEPTQAAEPGQSFYNIVDHEGRIRGGVYTTIKDGKAKIDNIEMEHGVDALGTVGVRDLLKQYRALHPEVTELSGERISGARHGGETVKEGPEVAVKLPGATPYTNQFGNVVKDTFEYPIEDAGKKVGRIEYINGTTHDPEANAITIRAAGIEDAGARGKGLGTDAYKQVIDWAHAQGKTVYSSGSTNALSDAVYERLGKQGYDVRKTGDTFEIPPSKYTQGDLLEAQQVAREAEWRTQQPENNAGHERFHAEAKAKLDRIEQALSGGGGAGKPPPPTPPGAPAGPPKPPPTPKQMNAAQQAARVIKNILLPDEVSPIAESAAADIRAAGGKAARDTEATRAAFDDQSRVVSRLSDQEKLGLIDYIENRSKFPPEPQGVVAAFYKGKLLKGKPGELHSDLVEQHKIDLNDFDYKRGDNLDLFVLKDGEVVNRGEMARRGLAESGEDLRDFGVKPTAEQVATPFEKRPQIASIPPELRPVADAIRTAMQRRVEKLQALPSIKKEAFIEDYFPHMWQDPAKAVEFAREFSSGTVRQGSGASLKARTVPTVADGLEAGLKPISVDPLEVSMRYVQSMDRFIATQEVLDKALADGTIKYVKPKVMGASGNPDSFQVPPGYVPVNGRGAVRGDGAHAYAPADWARVYNNFIDAGIHRNADWGKVYDAARNTSNAVTSLELGLSGFHAATMAQEAMVNAVAKGIGELASGRPISAAKSFLNAPVSPVTNLLKGRQLEATYLNKAKGTPLMQEITNLLTEAGGRAKGARHAPDYQYSQAGSYWDSFKRGSVLAEIKQAGADIRARPIAAPIKLLGQQVGRVMQTVAKPLFEYAIPKLKNGAFYDNMASWMEANPTADHAAQVKAARKIWNSIDNRFGEVVQDNIFWNKTLKQSLQVAMRSYSWTFGTIQEIGGGAKDLIRHPSSLSPKSQHYSPKAAYVIALPIVYATINAVYQKLKSGKDPEGVADVMRGGMTGGTAPGVGGRGTVPERAMMPGYMKDVFGWYHDPMQELKNKVATAPRMAYESLTNKDWKDQPIRDKNAPTMDQVRQYFQYVYQSLGPISVKQLLKGQKTGSNIGTAETLLGVHPVPSWLQDPKGYEGMMKGVRSRDWQKKERYDKRQTRQYGGP